MERMLEKINNEKLIKENLNLILAIAGFIPTFLLMILTFLKIV